MSSDEKRGSQRRVKRPVVPPGPVADLKTFVYGLYTEAGFPTLDQIRKWAELAEQAARDDPAAARAWQVVLDDMPSRDVISDRIIGGASLPTSQRSLVAVVKVLANAAGWDPQDAARRARDLWVAAWMADRAGMPLAEDAARVPTGAVRAADADLRRLGVHAAIKVAGVPDSVLPEYVLRDTDLDRSGVREKIAAAAEGAGGFVLLVGGSSVGKTRCAAEAVAAMLPDWPLVQPRPQDVAVLGAAPFPQMVVWLDELQRYLGGERGLSGADVLALLNSPHPAVIVATLRSDYYTTYTTPPEPGKRDTDGGERQVLDLANVVRIGPDFSAAEHGRACAAAEHDLQLKAALGTGGYGLTQTLAAAPQLVARWEDARTPAPYAWAVLTAALDTARLGALAPLSADFLRAAAPGYCTSTQQAEAPEDWFEQAMAYAAWKLDGAAAALAPQGTGMGQVSGYTAADYLVQHAAGLRRYERPPASIWDAALRCVRDPADAYELAISARNRLLYQYATALYQLADGLGDEYAAEGLARLLVRRGDLEGLRARAQARDKDAAWELVRQGDADGMRALWEAGDEDAGAELAGTLWERGDLDGARQVLQALAAAGGKDAGSRLTDVLAAQQDADGLRGRADAGDERAARRLAELLEERGDLEGAVQFLESRARVGDEHAAARLVGLLAKIGDLDRLRGRANAGDQEAAWKLAELLEERGDLEGAARALPPRVTPGDPSAQRQAHLLARLGDADGLRVLADAGDEHAARQLAHLLAERGDLEGLRARPGDPAFAMELAILLARLGDADGLRVLADAGDEHAARHLAHLLAERGDLEGAVQALAGRAAGGDQGAAGLLAELLARRGNPDEAVQAILHAARTDADGWNAVRHLSMMLHEFRDLAGAAQVMRHLADAGVPRAAIDLAYLLTQMGDLEEAERVLRARDAAGDEEAALPLADLLLERGDPDGAEQVLRPRAAAGDRHAAWRLAKLGKLDGLRARADAGDQTAAMRLAELLAERGDADELAARADADEDYAAEKLAGLLAERGDADELRARVDAGDRDAAGQLVAVLAEQGRTEEARQLRRFGLTPDGEIASPWRLRVTAIPAGLGDAVVSDN